MYSFQRGLLYAFCGRPGGPLSDMAFPQCQVSLFPQPGDDHQRYRPSALWRALRDMCLREVHTCRRQLEPHRRC
jgi:hypothetical protein